MTEIRVNEDLKTIWNETQKNFNALEGALVDCYITFLRRVAKYYLDSGRRVFFRENVWVHWGEGNFGYLLIEGNEETDDVFGDYIMEIRFTSKLDGETLREYKEINYENLGEIRYRINH
jgi:hypothetical protein